MPNQSARLTLPFILPSQAQKHVTHNEALERLDAVVQLSVAGFDAVTPPALASEGDLYQLGAGATGAWAGNDSALAYHSNGGWLFVAPQEGWRAWDLAANTLRILVGGAWQPFTPQLQNLIGLGIGTTSDATNRLAVASDASLFTHDGTDHRMVVNKAAAADTAALVFQDNYTGHAEMGLAGDNDFQVKVSDDGISWSEAMRVRNTDGVVTVPCLMSGKVTIDNDDFVSVPTPSAGGMVAISMVDLGYPQSTHSGLFSYDTGGSLSLYTLAKGASLENEGSTALTGTSSTDGRSALAVATGALLIENRHGGTRHYAYTFLNSY